MNIENQREDIVAKTETPALSEQLYVEFRQRLGAAIKPLGEAIAEERYWASEAPSSDDNWGE